MANTAAAKKYIRSSRRKKTANLAWKKKIKDVVKEMGTGPTLEMARRAQKIIDKAARSGVIKKNKANRLKSRLTKSIPAGATKK